MQVIPDNWWNRLRLRLIVLIAGRDHVAVNLIINRSGCAITIPNGVAWMGSNVVIEGSGT